MIAFRKGTYSHQDVYTYTYTYTAIFGGRMHSLTFHNDFAEFTSVRYDDKYIVKGKLINQ